MHHQLEPGRNLRHFHQLCFDQEYGIKSQQSDAVRVIQ